MLPNDEIVVTSQVTRKEYTDAVKPLRGRWMALFNNSVWSAVVVWAALHYLLHQSMRGLLIPMVAVFAVVWVIWWHIAARRTLQQLFPTPESILAIETRISKDGVTSKQGSSTEFAAWKSIKRIALSGSALIIQTSLTGYLYIFKSGIQGPPADFREFLESLRRGKYEGTLSGQGTWPPAPTQE